MVRRPQYTQYDGRSTMCTTIANNAFGGRHTLTK